MRRALRACVAAVAAATLAACTIRANTNTGYRPEPTSSAHGPVAGGLAVARFEDARPPRVYSTGGRVFLAYVPLIPYFTVPYERLDESANKADGGTSGFDRYRYPESMARAVADDLATSGLFDRVTYVADGSSAGNRFLLTGTLRASPLDKYVSSYGLGIAGVLFWLLPVPVAKTEASVTADLTLVDTERGDTVWQRTVSGRASRLESIYYPGVSLVYGGQTSFDLVPPPSEAAVDRDSLFGWHFEALRRGMADAKPDLAAAMAARATPR